MSWAMAVALMGPSVIPALKSLCLVSTCQLLESNSRTVISTPGDLGHERVTPRMVLLHKSLSLKEAAQGGGWRVIHSVNHLDRSPTETTQHVRSAA